MDPLISKSTPALSEISAGSSFVTTESKAMAEEEELSLEEMELEESLEEAEAKDYFPIPMLDLLCDEASNVSVLTEEKRKLIIKKRKKGELCVKEQQNRLKLKEKELSRKKDIVCMFLSYPTMNSVNRERHRRWAQDVYKMRHKLRQWKTSSGQKESDTVAELSSEIAKLQEHSLADIEAYVPPIIIWKMCNRISCKTQPADEKLRDLAVHCATRQILEELENPEVLKISISGSDSQRVTSALKDLPQVRQRFGVVLQIYAPLYGTVGSIEGNIAKQLGFLSDTGKLNIFLRNTSFFIIVDEINDLMNLYEMGNQWWNSSKIQKIVCTATYSGFREIMPMDLEIQMEDHLLSWELFCLNVGKVVQSSGFQSRGRDVVEKCCGHLLAVVLMARALKMVFDFSIWDHASYTLSLPHTSQMKDTVLFNALAFVLERSVSGSADECLRYCAFHMPREGMRKDDLILLWITRDLISTSNDGECIVGDLVGTFLLESFQNGCSIRMRDEIREVLVNPRFLLQGGKGLTKAPKDDAWEEATQIHLMNNKFSVLPTSPNCPQLSQLFLQNNPFLRVIPPLFFEGMPMLQILDLSHTKIRSLPHSLYALAQLQQLYLRGCQLFMELPPEVGKLNNLRVLDLKETEIRKLPVDVGRLTNLTCMKMWFYEDNDDKMIPQGVISNLSQLEELIIEVDPNDGRWSANVKDIVEEVSHLDRLETLQLYLPEVFLLNDLMDGSSINLQGMHFRFTVGRHQKRLICRRPPLKFAVGFEEQKRCLKYVNGGEAHVPTKIKELLRHATAFFLDRHSTATNLSEFGFENMRCLKFCMLSECNEIQAIADSDVGGYWQLPYLECLNLHYMKNLRSIWKGPLGLKSLPSLKALVLYACPQLSTIFTGDSLLELENLEELEIEDCPVLESILVMPPKAWNHLFKKLKKISLHYLPKLVSFFHGQLISPALEWMSFYDCPSLKTVSHEEFGSNELKVIAGEAEWWRELKWSSDFKPPHLDAIFVPIENDRDFISQLKEINDTRLMQEAAPCQVSGTGSSDSVMDPAAFGARKSSNQRKGLPMKQVRAGVNGLLPDDGFIWRKYRQKKIRGSEYPRDFYRCNSKHAQCCLATKQVQRSDDDPTIIEITYRGIHTCTQASSLQIQRAAGK